MVGGLVDHEVERFLREVAAADEPLVVLFDQQRAGEADRATVVGEDPEDASLIRLASMLAIEANAEWLVGRAYMSQQSMGLLLEQQPYRPDQEEALELTAA